MDFHSPLTKVASGPPLPPARPESGADERPRLGKKQYFFEVRGEGAGAAGGADGRAGRRRREGVTPHGIPAFQGTKRSLLSGRSVQICVKYLEFT